MKSSRKQWVCLWLCLNAYLKVCRDNMFSGLNEMLESDLISLEVCLSTVKLLMSEDR